MPSIWQLHLRRVGVEGQPEPVQGISNNGAGENSSDQNNEQEGLDDEAEHERRDNSGSTNENSGTTNENESPLALGSPYSGNFENQIFSNVHLSSDQWLMPQNSWLEGRAKSQIYHTARPSILFLFALLHYAQNFVH